MNYPTLVVVFAVLGCVLCVPDGLKKVPYIVDDVDSIILSDRENDPQVNGSTLRMEFQVKAINQSEGDTNTICMTADHQIKGETDCLKTFSCEKKPGEDAQSESIYTCNNLEIETKRNIVLRTFDTEIENKAAPTAFLVKLGAINPRRTIDSLTLIWNYKDPKKQTHAINIVLKREWKTIGDIYEQHYKQIERELKITNRDNFDKVKHSKTKLKLLIRATPKTRRDTNQVCMTNDRLTLEGATCVSCNSTTEDGRTTYSCDPTTLKLDRYIALTFIQKDQLVAYSLATWPIDRFTPPVLPPNPYERIVFIIHEYNDKFAFTFFLKSEPISLNYKSENETLIISDDSEKVKQSQQKVTLNVKEFTPTEEETKAGQNILCESEDDKQGNCTACTSKDEGNRMITTCNDLGWNATKDIVLKNLVRVFPDSEPTAYTLALSSLKQTGILNSLNFTLDWTADTKHTFEWTWEPETETTTVTPETTTIGTHRTTLPSGSVSMIPSHHLSNVLVVAFLSLLVI